MSPVLELAKSVRRQLVMCGCVAKPRPLHVSKSGSVYFGVLAPDGRRVVVRISDHAIKGRGFTSSRFVDAVSLSLDAPGVRGRRRRLVAHVVGSS